MRSLQEIRNRLIDHKSRLFRDYPIKSLAIFGSFTHGDQNDICDLDILVEFSDKVGIRFVDLADELESIVGFKVDLISKKGIKEKYLKAIDQDLIYV